LATAVSDELVECEALQFVVPPAFEEEISWHTIAPDFIAYGYVPLVESDFKVVWLIRFSKDIVFIGRIRSASRNA
jgi:hypothetical protein